MDDLCVHCGKPVAHWFGHLMHRIDREIDGHTGTVYVPVCADGSGHVACLPQGGVE